MKGAGRGGVGEEVLLQGGVCKEKVSQQGEHGPREDGGEEQCEDNEGQEEETQGEKTEESQGEKTGEKRHCLEKKEAPQGDGQGSHDGTWRRSGNQDGTMVWTKGTGRYDQAATARMLGTQRERDGKTQTQSGKQNGCGSWGTAGSAADDGV